MGYFEFKSKDLILGSKQEDIFKTYGAKAAITDFAIMLGGGYDPNQYLHDKQILKNRTGFYYTSSYNKALRTVEVIYTDGQASVVTEGDAWSYGSRPSLFWDILSPPLKKMNEKGNIHESVENGITKYECFEFPQSAVREEIANELNKELLTNVKKTGKVYSFPKTFFPAKKFKDERLEEYEYNGRKYVRLHTDSLKNNVLLSNNMNSQTQRRIWIEVEPIVWLYDTTFLSAITEKIIIAGIPYEKNAKIKTRFDKNTIGIYLKDYFSTDIIPSNGIRAKKNTDFDEEQEIYDNEEEIISDEIFDSAIAYDFDFDDSSDEEMIDGCIKSDIAVFLHGKSSDGKSARVKQIDPNCEIVYLRNATPESLNGKSIYNEETGEMKDIPPTWYKKLKEKCENEPDKLHVLFFDELTNALPSIQGMAFNIILDKEVNGIWKLPSNARIVAAGNDIEDSLAANQMAQPLFNRFFHVYIDTTVEKWLKWAAKPENNIHPSIYSYIAYKSYCKNEILRTEYDGIKPNADPRKWEMASKMLYATKNPEMLRALIGTSLTEDFIAFSNHQVITLEDVINHNYTDSDIERMGLDAKFATAVGLSKCEEKDMYIVRNFMSKLGAEVLKTFDVLANYHRPVKETKTQKNKITR